MEKLKAFWWGLSQRARIALAAVVGVGLVAGLALTVLATRGPKVDAGQHPDTGRVTQAVKSPTRTTRTTPTTARARRTVRAPATAKKTVARTTARKSTKVARGPRKAATTPTKVARARAKAKTAEASAPPLDVDRSQ